MYFPQIPALLKNNVRLGVIPLVLVAGSLSSVALAHAHLTGAVPPVDSTVGRAPAEVAIDYSERLEPRFSSIEVTDASGARVDTGDVHVAPGNDKQLTVGVGPLKPGVYKVVWRVMSKDTHRTEGSYSFTLVP